MVVSGAQTMPAPPDIHPTWLEVVFGGGFLAVVIPKLLDMARGAWLFRRKEDATIVIAKMSEDAKFRTDLMFRVTQLEKAAQENEDRMAAFASEQKYIRRQLETILSRGEAAIGGEPGELLAAMRSMVIELRSLLGRDTFPKSTVIGDNERTQGT